MSVVFDELLSGQEMVDFYCEFSSLMMKANTPATRF